MQKYPDYPVTDRNCTIVFSVAVLLWLQSSGFALARDSIPVLSEAQWEWLGDRVFANECSRQPSCLTAWNEGEEFPSLGIGHFIWYPAGSRGPFAETFPQLLEFLERKAVAVPRWLLVARDSGAPWNSREEFLRQAQTPEMRQLRQFLLTTQPQQTEFIIERFYADIPAILGFFPESDREWVRQRIVAIATDTPPFGLYALIDYVHFKGTGLKPTERYFEQGWGLAQVLENMDARAARRDPLQEFTVAAATVLRQRVANSPPQRQEQRWLNGWLRRLRTYLPDGGHGGAPDG